MDQNLLPFFLLLVAAFLLAVNLRTYRSSFAKWVTYHCMWAAVAAAVIVALI